jgi:hypothetical protein
MSGWKAEDDDDDDDDSIPLSSSMIRIARAGLMDDNSLQRNDFNVHLALHL